MKPERFQGVIVPLCISKALVLQRTCASARGQFYCVTWKWEERNSKCVPNCRSHLSLLNQYILFEPSEILLPALREVLGEVLGSRRQEACRFDLRAAGASAFSVLLGLSWYLPLVRQMEGCEIKEQKWWCDLVAEQSIRAKHFLKWAGN